MGAARSLDWLTAQPIAHRGLHDRRAGRPENTLAAFAAAIARSYAIECDVRLTVDGEAVVFHDADLRRLTGSTGEIATTSLAAMRRLRILGTAEAPPSLADMLALIAGRVPVLIELKSIGAPGALEAAVFQELRRYRGHAAVMAFAPGSVAWFRHNAPEVIRGQLSGAYRGEGGPNVLSRFAYRHLLMLGVGKPDFVAHETICLGLPSSRLWRRFGGPLLTWTAKTPADYARARPLADAIIFEGFEPAR